MLVTPDQLFAYLDSLKIVHSTVEHRPLFTVEDGRDLHHMIPGLHCKNLFLKNKKGHLWLVVMPCEKRANLAILENRLESGRLSFGKAGLLMEVLGVTAGAVTPFALIHDTARRVTVVLDADVLQAPMVNFHPLRNDASTTIHSRDIFTFLSAFGVEPVIMDCGS